jgi:hypothetical protein
MAETMSNRIVDFFILFFLNYILLRLSFNSFLAIFRGVFLFYGLEGLKGHWRRRASLIPGLETEARPSEL